MRHVLIVCSMLIGSAAPVVAQVNVGIGIGLPGVSIGINLPAYPDMAPIPGYPGYYAPQLNSNFFFYDGMYWVYQRDNWYASSWYNGPWGQVVPESVPLFVLRIPVRYYRSPPPYFYGWQQESPPRWGEHWGRGWEQRRSGWDRWNRSSVLTPAPLPVYQRQYSGDRYPQAQQREQLHNQNYRYQPHDAVVRQQYQDEWRKGPPAPSKRQPPGTPYERYPVQQDGLRSNPQQPIQHGPREQPPQRGGEDLKTTAPAQRPSQPGGPTIHDQRQQPQQGAVPREREAPPSNQIDSQKGKGPTRDQKQGQGRDKDEERGQGRP